MQNSITTRTYTYDTRDNIATEIVRYHHQQNRFLDVAQPRSASIKSVSSGLTLGVKELYISGAYSDLTIESRGRKFKVHKAILHTQSSWFRSALGGKFQEAKRNTLILDADEPAVLEVLLHFFYHSALRNSSKTTEEAEASFLVKVYAIADKYDVPALRDLAAQRFEKIIDPVN